MMLKPYVVLYYYYVVLNQISLVCKVYYKYHKQTLPPRST